MANAVPKALIFGHSFVRRLRSDIDTDGHLRKDFNLVGTASVKVVAVCLVIPRGIRSPGATDFAQKAIILNNYLRVVLEPYQSVFCWTHKVFNSPFKVLFLPAGVHVNPAGQHFLYRSCRGAILKALTLLT